MVKPKDLRIPFTFEERHPAILDRLLYVPVYYDKHGEYPFLDFSDEKIFANNNPVKIEYCSGNGEWLIEKARKYPDINWIGVEKRFDRARKIWVKAHNLGLKNLFTVLGEGLTFTSFYLKENSLSEVFVNFPDPWPKKKHAKHRLANREFLAALKRVLKPGSGATFVTDDAFYAGEIVRTAFESEWRPCFPKPYYVTSWPNYGGSYFHALWAKKGLTIRYLRFVFDN